MKTGPFLPVRVRTLLVDDFRPFRRFLSSILEQTSHIEVIGEAGTGIEAVRLAQELQPDLILLDIGLPQLNGIEAAGRIRTLSPGSKIVFVTLTADAAIMKKALQAGAAYIVKTDAHRELLPAIDAVLRGESFVSGRLAGAACPEVNDAPRIESD